MSRRRSFNPKLAAVIAAASTPGKGQRIGKSFKELREIEELIAAAAKYDGPVRRCPPGVARAHETKVAYMPPKPAATPRTARPQWRQAFAIVTLDLPKP